MNDVHLLSELPALNAVKLGNLYFKPREIEAVTSRMVRPLASEYVGDEPIVGIIGSSTLLRNSKGLFAACTRHQLALNSIRPFSEEHVAHVRVTSHATGHLTNITTNGVQFVSNNSDEEFSDILLFRADNDAPNLSMERPYFAHLVPTPPMPRRKSWAIGFPTGKNRMDHQEKAFNSVCEIIGCEFDSNFKTAARFLRRYKFVKHQATLDGFSGGAIFSLFGDIGKMIVLFDGLIVRGGGEYVYAVTATPIIRLANAF